jgi:hypothetical protein
MSDNLENPWRINLRNTRKPSDRVVFRATPDLTENRNVIYNTIDPVHAPGSINVYQKSSSRSFDMSSIKLISRTVKEADLNLRQLWLLKSWTMPHFGTSSLTNENRENRERQMRMDRRGMTPGEREQFNEQIRDKNFFGVEFRGAPPSVLYLSAYSKSSASGIKMQHVCDVPVAITQLSIPYPSDVDYIHTSWGVPMPTILQISITLSEMQSPVSLERFSLDHYRSGVLRNY